MKLPTDLVKMYKEIHGWVGIISGLALFIAFYAGAITMFEEPLQRWASPPSRLAPPPSLERTPELIDKVLAAHPQAAKDYEISLAVDSARPARMSWTDASGDEHGGGTTHYASLAPDGSLQVETTGPSPVAQFIDVLHQQVGLTFLPHEIAMPIMGAISLLYAIAIVSGLVVLLPSLVSDLFALRIGKNVKRMWLDIHNLLGVFSLPFHLVMALTCVVFAFHDQFYDAQAAAFGRPDRPAREAAGPQPAILPPAEIVARLGEQAPGFTPIVLDYSRRPDGSVSLRVAGSDPRFGTRGPTYGFAGVDPATGQIKATDYMPGRQDGWSATITSFFALHFGSFGGAPIRWAYFLLGLSGAFIFYTGNLLWIESRRRRERKAGLVEQTRSTRVLGALTVGVPLGCVAGVSASVAAAKLLAHDATPGIHSAIYYAVFLAFVGWALARGAARSGFELAIAGAAAMLAVPLASLAAGPDWYVSPALIAIDLTAIALAVLLAMSARSARRRMVEGPRDSVWARTEKNKAESSSGRGGTEPASAP
ncbi:PepSY-associated TM helix domain-containing protein [Phenylobacterium sp.]|uniref:PepSY-associated TM helix domain-containing protein n=1 Tax=Phenylobacterium sp. TaxID=1871053 RepID=UPI0035AD90A1